VTISIIAADVRHTVTLDVPPYAAQITVSRRGSIDPIRSAVDGVYPTAPNTGVVNYGMISSGGSPNSSLFGGDGVHLATSSGTVINFGTVFGGANGGDGVSFGGTLNNSGLIVGAAGGAASGGFGVAVSGGSFANSGDITGGAGGGTEYGGLGAFVQGGSNPSASPTPPSLSTTCSETPSAASRSSAPTPPPASPSRQTGTAAPTSASHRPPLPSPVGWPTCWQDHPPRRGRLRCQFSNRATPCFGLMSLPI
jgi:hypothetical protein